VPDRILKKVTKRIENSTGTQESKIQGLQRVAPQVGEASVGAYHSNFAGDGVDIHAAAAAAHVSS
jgi:hypothetical protein